MQLGGEAVDFDLNTTPKRCKYWVLFADGGSQFQTFTTLSTTKNL